MIPIFGEHEREAPAEGAQNRRLHQVTIEQVRIGVVAIRVHEDAELVGMISGCADGEVAAITRLADIEVHRVAALAQGGGELLDNSVAFA